MNYFNDLELFASLTLADREKLSSFCQMRELQKWETLMREWEEASSMYLIVAGEFSVEKQGVVTNSLSAWDIVWEIAFLEKKEKRNATITCTSDWVIVAIIDYAISQMFEKYPDLYDKIWSIVSERQGDV